MTAPTPEHAARAAVWLCETRPTDDPEELACWHHIEEVAREQREAGRREGRAEAVEEAVRVVFEMYPTVPPKRCHEIAEAIRALRDEDGDEA